MNVILSTWRAEAWELPQLQITQGLIVKPCLRKKNKIMKHIQFVYNSESIKRSTFCKLFLGTVRTCYLLPIILFLIEDFLPFR